MATLTGTMSARNTGSHSASVSPPVNLSTVEDNPPHQGMAGSKPHDIHELHGVGTWSVFGNPQLETMQRAILDGPWLFPLCWPRLQSFPYINVSGPHARSMRKLRPRGQDLTSSLACSSRRPIIKGRDVQGFLTHPSATHRNCAW